jgi:hypothetical protein
LPSSWATPPFYWAASAGVVDVERLVECWIRIDRMSDEQLTTLGVDWSLPEGEPFFRALTSCVLEAVSVREDDRAAISRWVKSTGGWARDLQPIAHALRRSGKRVGPVFDHCSFPCARSRPWAGAVVVHLATAVVCAETTPAPAADAEEGCPRPVPEHARRAPPSCNRRVTVPVLRKATPERRRKNGGI